MCFVSNKKYPNPLMDGKLKVKLLAWQHWAYIYNLSHSKAADACTCISWNAAINLKNKGVARAWQGNFFGMVRTCMDANLTNRHFTENTIKVNILHRSCLQFFIICKLYCHFFLILLLLWFAPQRCISKKPISEKYRMKTLTETVTEKFRLEIRQESEQGNFERQNRDSDKINDKEIWTWNQPEKSQCNFRIEQQM